ncbi:hypothetical protein BRARA_E02510 [Brassica rapa]|uniref:Uncharacterized protein n=1 Tax=Brassica campestris TaxID=3711 RepID=A0A397ZCY8_BRACM|nr:hypothetical protein BRARA_E02510 [Brassica rapa]
MKRSRASLPFIMFPYISHVANCNCRKCKDRTQDLFFFLSTKVLERNIVKVSKMKLGSIIAVLLMLVLVSGEVSTKSSQAPAPELPLEAADSPPIPAPMQEVGSPLAEYPNEYSSPPEVGSPLAEYPNEYSSPPEVGSPLAEYPNKYYYPPSDSTPSPEAGDSNYIDITGVDEKKTLGRKGYWAY